MYRAFLDFRLYLFALIYAGLNLSLAVAAVFLPTIIGTLGFESVKANLMTAPVYLSAYGSLLVTAWLLDRFHKRGIPIITGGLISGTGFILLGILKNAHARYGMCFLAVAVS